MQTFGFKKLPLMGGVFKFFWSKHNYYCFSNLLLEETKTVNLYAKVGD